MALLQIEAQHHDEEEVEVKYRHSRQSVHTLEIQTIKSCLGDSNDPVIKAPLEDNIKSPNTIAGTASSNADPTINKWGGIKNREDCNHLYLPAPLQQLAQMKEELQEY